MSAKETEGSKRMPVCYNKLWKLLIDKGMNKTELRIQANVSTNVIAKLGKNKPVSLTTLEAICSALSCSIGDIVEFVGKDNQ